MKKITSLLSAMIITANLALLILVYAIPASAQFDEWIQITDGLYGGNVLCLAIDPSATSTVYAGTYGGGVFKYIPSTPVEIEDRTLLPEGFAISQNYPNPFKNSTMFTYSISKPGLVELVIHSYSGQYITTLVSVQQDEGSYSISWNTTDIATGVYFYTLKVDGLELVKKAIRIK